MHIVFSLLILLLSIGCQKTQPLLELAERDQLNLNFKYDPITLDPRKNADPISCALINLLYEGLTHLESDGRCSLGLAESIEISKNHTKYTFHLKDAKWSNGEPITSYDFEFSWKSILNPQFSSPNAYFLYPIKNARLAKLGRVPLDQVGIYIENAKTFSVKLEQPTTYFLKVLAFATYFPVWQGIDAQQEQKPVFSGPFLLEEWRQGRSLLLKKNPDFWDSHDIHLQKIHISILNNDLTALHLHQLHQLDCLGSFISPLPYELLSQLTKSQQAYTTDQAGTTMCFFNVRCFPFNNLNIRKAFAYAIHKQDIIDYICQNQEKKAYGVIPPICKHHREKKFTPEGSKELARHHFNLGLKELGITRKNFPNITFAYYTSPLEKNLALTLQQQWKDALGVDVTLEGLDVKVFLDKMHKKNYQFALMSILAQYFDPMNFLERFLHSDGIKNFCGWENQDFQHLIDSSYNTLSEEERLQILEKAEEVLISDFPIAPIYHHRLTYLKTLSVEGIQITPIGTLDFRKAYFKKK